MKKTVVIGASTNEERYSNKCIKLLREHKVETTALGLKKGRIADVEISTSKPLIEGVDTVAIYLSPKRQEEYYDYIIDLHPKRVLFPPGTENEAFYQKAEDYGILCEEACPLVMLKIGTY